MIANRNPRGSRAPAGFTLVELLVVIGIFGLLVAVALPAFQGIGQASAVRTAASELKSTLALARQYAVTRGEYLYVVFATVGQLDSYQTGNEWDARVATEAYRAYGVLAMEDANVSKYRFVADWRKLPAGVVFDTRASSASGKNVFLADHLIKNAVNQPPHTLASTCFAGGLAQPMVVFAPGGGLVNGPPVAPLSGGVEVFLTRGFCTTSNSTPTYTATNGFSVFTYALTGGQRMQEY